MQIKRGFILGITFSFIFFSFSFAFSQEQAQKVEIAPEAKNEPETQWVWGEIISRDDQKNEIVVKYLDYETDQEKELTLAVDGSTTYENIQSFKEIKPHDTAGIDYIVIEEGRNLAKNIGIENPEGIKTDNVSPAVSPGKERETAPEDSTKDKTAETTQPKS